MNLFAPQANFFAHYTFYTFTRTVNTFSFGGPRIKFGGAGPLPATSLMIPFLVQTFSVWSIIMDSFWFKGV